jgi:regulatory protein
MVQQPKSAVDVALRFLAQRPRTEQELRQRLARAGVDEATAGSVLSQLKQHGLVDDVQFAQYWVQQRQTFRPRGGRLLRAELRRRGVGGEEAEAAARAVAGSAEADAYRAAAGRARLLGRGAALDKRTFTNRIGQFLARRGFDWQTIAPVAERLWQEAASKS